MATQWTEAQKTAINTKNKTLLLSAAAGSGKTSTLTERIIRSITDPDSPADISKMLIVTFTRASATDLKTKIFNAVSNALAESPTDRHLTEQLIKLGSAKISTIDAFYLNAVKQNFSALGLSSSFRIADESETVLIARAAVSEIINKYYDTVEEFPALCECFESIRDTEGVMEDVLLDLYTDCMRTPEGVEYLRQCAISAAADADKEFLDTVYGKILSEHAISTFGAYIDYYEDVLAKMPVDEKLYRAYYDAMDSDRILCIKALNILEKKVEKHEYSDIAELINSYQFPAFKPLGPKFSTDLSVFCKSLRDSFKDAFGELKKQYFCYSQRDFSIFFTKTAQMLELLYRVLSDFEARYSEEKKHRNILELTDVKRYALKLFANEDGSPTELAISYSQQFTDIYIDEYQDVDPVQDLIFRCISTPKNRFMVGDIKQSIYSFRGARPQLFADYRAAFPNHDTNAAEGSDCETIFMSENFRCSKPVVDFTNLVCADIFRSCGASIGYTKEDDLVYAKKLPENATEAPDVNVAIFAKSPKKEISEDIDVTLLPSPAEAEAEYIAHEIYELIKHGRKQDGSRILPKDIAVLFRNKSAARRISDALSSLGIMTANTEAAQYFQNPDVIMTLCILNAVDNPQRDIQLAGALRSPIFDFTMDELLLINRRGDKTHSLYDKLCICAEEKCELGVKCLEFIKLLDEWRNIAASMPIDKFLKHIFASDAFVASGLVCEKNSLGEGGNLQRLYEYARTFEAGSFKGLYNFIEFINAIIENGKTIDVRSESDSDTCVTLTTIHKSKGLEYPVVFVCNASADFQYGSSNPNLSFEYGLGVAMTLSDSTGFAYYTSPLKKILDLNSKNKTVEEEMRILYVALTRARERLYVTGHYSKTVLPTITASADFNAKFDCDYARLSSSSYMEWILSAIKKSDGTGGVVLREFATDKLPNQSADTIAQANDTSEKNEKNVEMNAELYNMLKEKFSFKYQYSDLGRIPAKISVSKLSPDVLDQSDTSVELFDTETDVSVPEFFLTSPKKATSAERGTATHLFFQFCDFDFLRKHNAVEALAALVDRGFIPQKLADITYIDELEAFKNSEFMQKILNAKRIIREQRFNMLLPTSLFTQNPEFREKTEAEKIAVQGVIDLILIDDKGYIELYDYKTDRLMRRELESPSLACQRLNQTHGLQLSYYEKAITHLFGKSPVRVAVYSTHAARLFDIDIKELSIPRDIL